MVVVHENLDVGVRQAVKVPGEEVPRGNDVHMEARIGCSVSSALWGDVSARRRLSPWKGSRAKGKSGFAKLPPP
eukprot:CAMPEP_0198570452 /NCGR_PEP_ID=MMETSP1462-20131121/109139_1 /TAXON_ID=1333877 /ORGANISM="Brandtodinium nutriculum, Strain RCC3387" /LENGTH=73 /DNA_ID=CAMNT_0044301571 /DNA_START=144 /DNA_END=362 /DNA_ORIENTATION=-